MSGWGSPQELKEKATARPPQGWSTFRVNRIKAVTTKKNGIDINNIVFDLEHEDGTQTSWWINEGKRSASLLLAKLCEYEGINWDSGASGESIATLLGSAFTAIDAKIGYGAGDGAFVNDVALAGQGPSEEQGEVQAIAPVTSIVQPAPRRKANF